MRWQSSVPGTWRPTPLVRASLWAHGVGMPLVAAGAPGWPWLLGGLVFSHVAMAAGLHPHCQWVGRTLTRLPHGGMAPSGDVALTFDDGPDPSATPRILDLLDAAGARASFFCIGTRAARHPALIARMIASGHTVENHTWSHPATFAAHGRQRMAAEVLRAQRVLTELAGTPPRWMRAPAGLRSPLLEPVLAGAGLRHASWTRRAYDGRCIDPAIVAARLIRGLAPGDVLLLHDGSSARMPLFPAGAGGGGTVATAALPAVLDAIRARGLRAVALPAPLAVPALPGDAATPAAAHVARTPASA